LTEDLLTLARGEQSLTAQTEGVDLSTLLEDVAESLTPLAEAKGLSLECRVQPDLTVSSNRDGLIRLFVNLVDNAIKFTESGSITVFTRAEAGTVRISVRDTGRGISPEHLDHIFDRFYRANTSLTKTGAGLGLAIALQIAHAHGSDITVDSKPGNGTTFSITLPLL